jgi:hypothetical protein
MWCAAHVIMEGSPVPVELLMIRRTALFCLVLAACASPSFAQYGRSEVAWNDCGAAGTAARTFACNTNTGSEQIIVSFHPGTATDAVYQFQTVLTVGTLLYDVIPDWWAFTPTTGCRRTSLLASGDFSAASGACADPWFGAAFTQTTVTGQFYFGDPAFRRLVIRATVGIPYAAAAPLDPNTEYYGERLTLNHQKTVGTGACAGCSQPLCIALSSASTVANPDNPVTTSLWPSVQAAIVWNGGASCDRLVPAKNRTWGAIKTLYR